MDTFNYACLWIGELAPLAGSTAAFLYGAARFFHRGKALYLQIVTCAMGCAALGFLYHLCQSLTQDVIPEGFTASYLGLFGCFLFLLTANLGQMDGLLDDGSPQMRPSRYIGLLAPLTLVLLYTLCLLTDMPTATKITYFIVWIPALLSTYFNLKHAVIPDLGYGFVKAVRPYNISALALSITNFLLLIAWGNYDTTFGFIFIALFGVLFAALCIVTILKLERGVMKWTM